jgi:hypothetical protein
MKKIIASLVGANTLFVNLFFSGTTQAQNVQISNLDQRCFQSRFYDQNWRSGEICNPIDVRSWRNGVLQSIIVSPNFDLENNNGRTELCYRGNGSHSIYNFCTRYNQSYDQNRVETRSDLCLYGNEARSTTVSIPSLFILNGQPVSIHSTSRNDGGFNGCVRRNERN